MSADPNSPESLFAAAQDVARRLGLLESKSACQESCRCTKASYVLNDSNGVFIARLPMAKVRRTAQERHRQLLHLKGIREVAQISQVRQIDRHTTFRSQPDEIRALAWALSDGRRIPSGAFSKRDWVVGLVLLIPGIIPGMIYFAWASWRHQQYARDMKALMMRWRGKKRPDPSNDWFESLGE